MNELIRLANCHLDTLDSTEIPASQIFTHKKHKDKDESTEDLQAFGNVRPLEEGQKRCYNGQGASEKKLWMRREQQEIFTIFWLCLVSPVPAGGWQVYKQLGHKKGPCLLLPDTVS